MQKTHFYRLEGISVKLHIHYNNHVYLCIQTYQFCYCRFIALWLDQNMSNMFVAQITTVWMNFSETSYTESSVPVQDILFIPVSFVFAELWSLQFAKVCPKCLWFKLRDNNETLYTCTWSTSSVFVQNILLAHVSSVIGVGITLGLGQNVPKLFVRQSTSTSIVLRKLQLNFDSIFKTWDFRGMQRPLHGRKCGGMEG